MAQSSPRDMMKVLEFLHKRKENSNCFDCREKGTTFVNITIGTFVCTKCAGLLRELNFAVKGLGVSVLKDKEVLFVEEMGNQNAKKIWLAKFDDIRGKCPNSRDLLDVQQHLNEIYVQKRYYVAVATPTETDNSSLNNTIISFKSCDVKNTSVNSTNNNSMIENDTKFDSKSASPGSNVDNTTKKPSMFKKSQSTQIVQNIDKNIPLTTKNSSDNKVFDFSLFESSFNSASNNNTQNSNQNNNLVTHDFTKNKKVMDCVNDLYKNYNTEKKVDNLDKLFYQYNFSTGNNMRTNTQPMNNMYQTPYYQQNNMFNNNQR